MEAIISLSEFMQANEIHMTGIILFSLAVFGGVSFAANMFLDMGFFLYQACKKALPSLLRRVKK